MTNNWRPADNADAVAVVVVQFHPVCVCALLVYAVIFGAACVAHTNGKNCAIK